jgi:hypothetical protein
MVSSSASSCSPGAVDVHPEALAVLALFQGAAGAEQVDRALLERIAGALQRTRLQSSRSEGLP